VNQQLEIIFTFAKEIEAFKGLAGVDSSPVTPPDDSELCDHGVKLSEAVSYKCRECWEATLDGAMEQADHGSAAHIRAGAPFDPCPSIHQPCLICEALLEKRAEAGEPAPDGWIPVSERLPEDCQTVLATRGQFASYELNTHVCEYEVAAPKGMHANTRFRYVGSLREFPGVTHWQPLPAPPKAKDGEQ